MLGTVLADGMKPGRCCKNGVKYYPGRFSRIISIAPIKLKIALAEFAYAT
jgi:hypothetical protein